MSSVLSFLKLMSDRGSSFVLALFLFLVVSGFFVPNVSAANPATPVLFSFEGQSYAYYQADPSTRQSWVIIFLSGGLGGNGELLGCGGNLFRFHDPNGKVIEACWPVPSKYWWLAGEFMNAGFDMINPLTYRFNFGMRDWLINLLRYARQGLGYEHVLLAGFSAGGAVTGAAIAWYGQDMNALIDAAAIYEGPTLQTGALGSANIAYNVTVPTFLVYGSLDDAISPNMPGVPPENGIRYADQMNDAIARQLIILEKGHDDTVIVDTLPQLLDFLEI